jgi:chromosomal replication initiator protein
MFLAKELTLSSLKTIGLHFGGRDHSTVIHACNSIEDNKRKDPSFQNILEDIRNKVELAGY